MLHAVAIWMAAGYGVLALGGGVMGYLKANSRASLIAGGVSGVLLLGGAWLASSQPVAGLAMVCIVSAALVARFGKSALAKRATSVAYVMLGGGILVLVSAGMALA
jgi:uncharacterized membrane protein (UPF0136 family)